eukprot:6990916-Pyramimonas_sp.AAC.1
MALKPLVERSKLQYTKWKLPGLHTTEVSYIMYGKCKCIHTRRETEVVGTYADEQSTIILNAPGTVSWGETQHTPWSVQTTCTLLTGSAWSG